MAEDHNIAVASYDQTHYISKLTGMRDEFADHYYAMEATKKSG